MSRSSKLFCIMVVADAAWAAVVTTTPNGVWRGLAVMAGFPFLLGVLWAARRVLR